MISNVRLQILETAAVISHPCDSAAAPHQPDFLPADRSPRYELILVSHTCTAHISDHFPASCLASMKPEPTPVPAPGHVDAPTM